MKKSILACVLFISITGYSQVAYFNNRYDLLNHDASVSVIAKDSGYLFGGVVDLTNDWRIGLMELDLSENVKWEKTYGSIGLQYSAGGQGSLIKTFDGWYALGGGRNSGTNASNVGMLWRFDTNGDTLWTNWFGSTTQYFETFYQCKQTPDSGFILIGMTTKVDTNGDIWLVKTDKDGNFEWDTTYGGAGVEYGFSVDVCFDGGYILGGYTNSFGNGGYDTYIVKTDSTGNKLWDKTYGGIYDDNGAYVIQTYDSGFFISTALEKFQLGPNAYKQTYLIKTDSAGSIEWDTTYGPTRYATGPETCSQLANGSFVVIGQQLNKDSIALSGSAQGFILKVSSQGDSLWYRVHEYDTCLKNDDYFRDMKPTSDGGFIVAGFFTPNTSFQCNDTGTQDMWVMKLDSCGCAYPNCDIACSGDTTGVEEFQISGFRFQIYPNPTDGKFIIEMFDNSEAEKPYQISIYDILGREIKEIKSKSQRIEVDISGLDAGIYLIKIRDENIFYHSRVVKY